MIIQREFRLRPRRRGFHLITREVEAALPQLPRTGLLHLFIGHTSAALSLNENADADVRTDLATAFDGLVRDGDAAFIHTAEGADDMSAHVKSTMIGASVTVPITGGRLDLGRWQGIYLCEFRNVASARTVVATVIGE